MVAKKSVFLGNVRKKCKEKMMTQTLPKGTGEEQAKVLNGLELGWRLVGHWLATGCFTVSNLYFYSSGAESKMRGSRRGQI